MSSFFPRILFSVVCVLAAANPVLAAESAEDAAGKVAMDFINAHVAEPVGYEETIARVEASPLVTARYKSALAKLYRDALKEEPDLGYGADAVIGGQDNPDRFRVKSAAVNGDLASVVLIGEDPDFPMEVKVELVKENGQWLVDASGDLSDTESE